MTLSLDLAIGVLGLAVLALVGSTVYRALPAPLPPAPLPPVAPVEPPSAEQEAARVEVLNACGVRGAARAAASLLRAAGGVDVVNIGNAPQGMRLGRTLVLDRSGERRRAELVAAAMGGVEVLLQRAAARRAEVTVLVGYDRGRWEEEPFSSR